MIKKIYVLLLFGILLLFAGCSLSGQPGRKTEKETEAGDQLHIVTTAFPPYDFARQLAGAGARITMLLKPGSEAHTYEPTPQDMIAIQNCELFLCIGGESEDWVDQLLESIDNPSMEVLALTDCVELLEEDDPEDVYTRDSAHDLSEDGRPAETGPGEAAGQEMGEADEHVWTDPSNVVKISRRITKLLQKIRPENEDVYEENLAAYEERLGELDGQIREIVANGRRKELVFGDRFPFRYFADAYGLTCYAAFPGCSSESEPSAAVMVALADRIKKLRIPVVFTLEMSSQKIADTLCEETGAKKLVMHSCHNVSRDEFERGETYLSLMEKNAEALKNALN